MFVYGTMYNMKKKIQKIYEFPVVTELDDSGYYFAYVPALQGCYTQGKTLDEALKNIEEVIELHIEDRRAHNEIIPKRRMMSLSAVQVLV